MYRRFWLVSFVWMFFSSIWPLLAEDYTQFVDPLIGSAKHGHVFVGASVPFGMVELGPTNLSTGWDWCSGYNYSDSTIIGFSHNHLEGTGIGDLGDILFMPVSKKVPLFKGTQKNLTDGYVSTFKHCNEQVRPGYYSVLLDKYGIRVELTATKRVGMHRYTYPRNGLRDLIIDLGEGIGPGFGDRIDETVASSIRQTDSVTIEGYRFSSGWAKNERIYFVATFSTPFSIIELQRDHQKVVGNSASGKIVKALLDFGSKGINQVIAKVGISYVSCDNARLNLETELPGWNFDQIVKNANHEWNSELGKIKAEFSDIHQKRTFYTALYHTMIDPSIFSDVNGDYRGSDNTTHNASSWVDYTVFSLWDTYRAVHPLFTLIEKDKVGDFVNSLLAIYEQQGRFPVWPLVGNETDCMTGSHSVPIIIDAYFKGIKGFDINRAYQLMKLYPNVHFRGLPYINQFGYIPADKESGSVSSGLEFCIDDWCIAQLAKSLGKSEDYIKFNKRAQGYHDYFDKSSLFMRPKLSNGKFIRFFDPSDAGDNYIEGNAWQYTWLVPQDVEGMMRMYNSPTEFVSRLDTLFSVSSQVPRDAPIDMSGMIGQYVQGNEPSHHISYLYAFAGVQWKTAEKVRQVMKTFYIDTPSGLCGNDDCGQMSAWYVFSALGFYPVNPVNGIYVLGSPLIDKAKIFVGNGKRFILEVKNNNSSNLYIQSATLNGKPYGKSYLKYSDIEKGGYLILIMGSHPNVHFGTRIEDRPYSAIK